MKTLILLLLLGSVAVAQEAQIPNSKRPKTLIVLSLLQLGAAGADAYYTNRNFSTYRCCEANPIARPFVGSTGGRVAYFSASAGLHIGGAWLLRRHHHNKLADLLLVEGIADHTWGAAHNASN